MSPCPCGSGRTYADCCEPLHDGRERAATAEQLMRSRYAAYAWGRTDYVFRTWHPRTRPADVEPVAGLVWTGLRVLAVEAGGEDDADGVVELAASHDGSGGPGVLHERSRFVRRAGRWVYLDGRTEARCDGTLPEPVEEAPGGVAHPHRSAEVPTSSRPFDKLRERSARPPRSPTNFCPVDHL